jgi:uncharacterized membrane protein required for colicin V production
MKKINKITIIFFFIIAGLNLIFAINNKEISASVGWGCAIWFAFFYYKYTSEKE